MRETRSETMDSSGSFEVSMDFCLLTHTAWWIMCVVSPHTVLCVRTNAKSNMHMSLGHALLYDLLWLTTPPTSDVAPEHTPTTPNTEYFRRILSGNYASVIRDVLNVSAQTSSSSSSPPPEAEEKSEFVINLSSVNEQWKQACDVINVLTQSGILSL